MSKFLTSQFWFQLNPELSSSFVFGVLVTALAFLLVAIYGHYKQKEKTIFRTAWRSVFSLGLGNFFLYLIWWFFAFEGVPLLSVRFWFVAFAIFDLIWMFNIYKKFKKKTLTSPELEAQKINKRYIP